MSFRVVVISSSAKLDLKFNTLVIRNEEITKIHLSEIAVLILESTAISITTALLCELTKKKVKIIFCDEKRNPLSEIVPYYGSHDHSMKLLQQTKWEEELKQYVWTEIIRQKIKNQSNVLGIYMCDEEEKLLDYIDELEFYDKTNREGHAAKVYFNALFGKNFTRGQDNNINSALNYGYSILLSAFNREIISAGYSTSLGLFHNNMFNPYNLSCDLMETFRPLVDLKVKRMDLTEFSRHQKMELVALLNTEVMIDGKKQYLLNAIKIYVKSIFNVLNKVEDSMIRNYGNEL